MCLQSSAGSVIVRACPTGCPASGRHAPAPTSCWPSVMVTSGCAARRAQADWLRNCSRARRRKLPWRLSTHSASLDTRGPTVAAGSIGPDAHLVDAQLTFAGAVVRGTAGRLATAFFGARFGEWANDRPSFQVVRFEMLGTSVGFQVVALKHSKSATGRWRAARPAGRIIIRAAMDNVRLKLESDRFRQSRRCEVSPGKFGGQRAVPMCSEDHPHAPAHRRRTPRGLPGALPAGRRAG